ncbi:hypothetical protein [Streptomyces sp. NPDC057287]|uniref:hypothetical protein n=1 Tax=Streptomyces sp. NPDC057287 TaxID=3346086 RepID=UPI003637F50C
MADRGAWSAGPAGDAVTQDGGLVSLLGRTVHRESPGRTVITPIVCRWCDWDQFEVVADECFCEGCCLPIGLAGGHVHAGGATWEFAPSARPLPWLTRVFRRSADPVCPAGHDVFQVLVAHAPAANGQVRRLSVGLRCPVDGALRLHHDSVRVVSSTT